MSEKLAKDGGAPVVGPEVKLPGWPVFDEETIQAAMEPLRAGKVNYWTGPKGMEFEQKFADWVGCKFGISTTNGTAALHTALAGLGVGPGDEVIVTSYSFIASSFCVLQAGAIPVFADVRKEDHTIDPLDIERKVTPKTKAIIPVHLYGQICDMDPIMEIARKHNLVVVEDCAQAHGGMYKGRKVGSIGHAGAFSFCQSKHFTTGGEGGCVVTSDEDVAWICRSFRDHGYDVRHRMNMLELEAKLPYIHNMVGFNYRLTEMQSVIGLKCLEKLDNWNLKNRRTNGEYLLKALKDCPQLLHLPVDNDEKRNAFWLFPIVVDLDKLTCDVKTFTKALEAEGIPVGPVLWPQAYKEKAFTEHGGFGSHKFPFESEEYTNPESVKYADVFCANAAWLEDRTFFTVVHPTMDQSHMELIAKAILKVAAAYAK
ncbi:MAG: DegT/DnrJ/EryC1/StrS family aminotransferase [bacterium]|nr:DegT/DnrJ/EryC1/StrS family aminotransferase [bacterium]